MNIFDIEKDINQLKGAGKDIKKIVNKIEKENPTITSVTKSIFIIIKWFIFLLIIIFFVFFQYINVIKTSINDYKKEKEENEFIFPDLPPLSEPKTPSGKYRESLDLNIDLDL